MRLALLLCAMLALAGCHQAANDKGGNAAAANESAEAGPVKGVDTSHRGQAAPAATFLNPDGKPMTLAGFTGVPVLVNLWASWCAPCVKELPTLDRLAAAHRDDGQLGVITISEDSAPKASVDAFLAKLKVHDLGAYRDPKMALTGALGSDTVLPTSILYDAHGREVWRYVGDLDWTGPEAARLLSQAGGASAPH